MGESRESIVTYSLKRSYFLPDFTLTPPFPEPTMQPESSDGLASVGTILPEEMAAPFEAAISVS